MRGIVQAKPFVKKKIKKIQHPNAYKFTTNKKKKQTFNFSKKNLGRVIAGSVVFVWILLLFFIRSLLFQQEDLIKIIHYDPLIQQQLNTTELLVQTSKALRGKYYHSFFNSSDVLSQIQEEFPFVSKIKIESVGVNEVSVNLIFSEPVFTVLLWEIRYGVWQNGYTHELYSGSTLGLESFLVDTPFYASEVYSLQGFFYAVSPERYFRYIPLIQAQFPQMERFVYLVGSDNFVVFEGGQMIFFSKEKLEQQFQKHRWLKSYYPDYQKLYKIDLASFVDDKIVIQ